VRPGLTQVILVVKNKVALTHKCVEDYRLSDKSVLDLIHLKEVRAGAGAGLSRSRSAPRERLPPKAGVTRLRARRRPRLTVMYAYEIVT
jgi:hypothetical protein